MTVSYLYSKSLKLSFFSVNCSPRLLNLSSMACIPGKSGTYNHFVDISVPNAKSIFSRVGAIDASQLLYSGDDVVSAVSSRILDTLKAIDRLDRDKLFEESQNLEN